MFGAAAGELASRPMTASASSVGSSLELDRGRAGEDLGARRLDHRVDPDGEALVAVGLHLDVLAELLGLVDHLVPGLRRGLDQVLAVPEQLGVGVERRAVELALERGGLDDAVEDVLGHLRLQRVGPLAQPAGVGELGRPDHVHADHVDRSSPRRRAGGRAARAAGSASVGSSSTLIVVLAARLLGAALGDLLDRAAGLGGDEPVQVHPLCRRSRPSRSRRGRRAPPRAAGLRFLVADGLRPSASFSSARPTAAAGLTLSYCPAAPDR